MKAEVGKAGKSWLALVVGIVLVLLGSLNVPLAYRLILLSDVLIMAGLVLIVIAVYRLANKNLPDITVMDGFIVSGLAIIFVIGAAYMAYTSYSSGDTGTAFASAIFAGALGGLVHEIFQSGGQFAMPQKKDDAWYLGSLAGLLFGALAGIILSQSVKPSSDPTTFVIQAFLAGVALKGVAEAATDAQAKS
jgi:hypothetical protein